MERNRGIAKLEENITWDNLIIGGGATGLGIAVDSASRGYKTVLLEAYDFAKGTSSRSTKLIHGGVRYLGQGDISMVKDALRERGILKSIAPHLVHDMEFVIPFYKKWTGLFYRFGLKIYDHLSGSKIIGSSYSLTKEKLIKILPGIKPEHLTGGAVYYDTSFNDSRFAINLAHTCADQGGVVINYMKVKQLCFDDKGKVNGVIAEDLEKKKEFKILSTNVINATGVFVDKIIQLEKANAKKLIRFSQGVHLVVDSSFLPGNRALVIPKTSDGRILFAIPWYNKVLLGTTDTPVNNAVIEPLALKSEISFILKTAGKYLKKEPKPTDVLSVFAGLRPLKSPENKSKETRNMSRSHGFHISPAGMVSVLGGKWTTYRKIAEDTINLLIANKKLEKKQCITSNLKLHGAQPGGNMNDPLSVYGTDKNHLKKEIKNNADLGNPIHEDLPYLKVQVTWAVKEEMARSVEDVLARRTRALFLDASTSKKMAPDVAKIMAPLLDKNDEWVKNEVENYHKIADQYLIHD